MNNSPPLWCVIGGPGKTCTAHLLRHLLEQGAGEQVGLITPRHTWLGGAAGSPPLWPHWQETFAETLTRMSGCDRIILAVPVQLTATGWLNAYRFDTVIVTSLGSAKARETVQHFLRGHCGCLVCNLDDSEVRLLVENWSGTHITYAERRNEADINARNLRVFPDHIDFEALTDDGISRVHLPVTGGFGLYHALAALACGKGQGMALETMTAVLSRAPGVPGRMELHCLPDGKAVLIDSARTPEQLETLLVEARGLTDGKLWLVLGAPGDRSRSSRRLLGETASRLADHVIFTADDPRSENAEEICRELRQGVCRHNAAIVPDRRAAILRAVKRAEPEDLVVLAGRGDSTSMLVGTASVPFDERQVLQELSAKRR